MSAMTSIDDKRKFLVRGIHYYRKTTDRYQE